MFEGKARACEKAERTRQYVSIASRIATKALDIRGGFKNNSKNIRYFSSSKSYKW